MHQRSMIAFMALLVAGAMLGGTAIAAQSRGAAELETPGTARTLVLPDAAGNSRVIDLGEAFDADSGQMVQGYAIIERKDGEAKPDGVGGGKGKGGGGGTSSCYAYMAKGAAWKGAPEPWVVNPVNTDGIADATVFSILDGAVDEWETSAGADILGEGSLTADLLEADTASTDGVNEVYFGTINGDPNIIAVTIVWGIFGGPPSGRQLVEWDQIYGTAWNWATDGNPAAMDFENISTHEIGHAMGMDHPDSTCTEETMYAYSNYGENIRRDLYTGDIAGIDALY